MENEFKSFGKIPNIEKSVMTITQKLDGTNAQIYIKKEDTGHYTVMAGSRNRWITPDDDNFGFAKFVHDNSCVLIEVLGEGRHFGEWCGPGINNGEGLSERTLFLFNFRRFLGVQLPDNVELVPQLYFGKTDISVIDSTMEYLGKHGSRIVPGYMHTEGVVIEIDGHLYKKTFHREDKPRDRTNIVPVERIDINYLLQPERLKKLLSRDEKYIRQYPVSLKDICCDYVKDLEDEGFFIDKDKDLIKSEKKELGRQLFKFVKDHISNEIFFSSAVI